MHYDNFKITKEEQLFIKTIRNLWKTESTLRKQNGNDDINYPEFVKEMNEYYWDMVQTVKSFES